jgi:hypothetical protein
MSNFVVTVSSVSSVGLRRYILFSPRTTGSRIARAVVAGVVSKHKSAFQTHQADVAAFPVSPKRSRVKVWENHSHLCFSEAGIAAVGTAGSCISSLLQ